MHIYSAKVQFVEKIRYEELYRSNTLNTLKMKPTDDQRGERERYDIWYDWKNSKGAGFIFDAVHNSY